MFDVENQIVVGRISPILGVERPDECFLLAIALFNNFFGRWTIGAAQAHDARNAVWQRRNNLDMKRRSHGCEGGARLGRPRQSRIFRVVSDG